MGTPAGSKIGIHFIAGVVFFGLLCAGGVAYLYANVVATAAYAPLHLMTELVGIVVAAAAFMITWNTRRSIENGYIIVIAMAGACVAGVDLVHALVYRGVDLVPIADLNLPMQLWLIARYLQAASILIAPYYIGRRVSAVGVLGWFAAATILLLGAALRWGTFPVAYSAPAGLTTFAVLSELCIALAMGAGLLALVIRRSEQDPQVFALMAAAITSFIGAELAFAVHEDPYTFANYMAHLLRVAGAILIYRAMVEAAVARPLDILFGDFKATAQALELSEERFRTTFDQAILGIVEIDTSGFIVKANQRVGELVRKPDGSVVGEVAGDLTLPADRDAEQRLFDALKRGAINEYRLEKRMCCPPGPPVWVSANRSAVLDGEGSIRYYIEMLEDVTIRRETAERLERARDLKSALSTIDAAVNSTFELDEILQTTVVQGARAIGAESAVVMMLERTSWVVRTAWAFPEDVLGTTMDAAAMADMVRDDIENLPLAIEDAANDTRVSTEYATRFGVKSLIVIPLGFRGQQLGLLFFNYHMRPRTFDEQEIGFVIELSSALTLAIENARLYEAERTTVDTLQASLLRIETDIPGLDIGTAYYSAVDLARIGGDFFDVFALTDDRVAFAVGDVAGKGIEAAAITAIAKSTVRAFAYEWGSPARVVRATNQALLNQLDESRFVTLVYGLLDVTTGEVRIVCAGHPSPLICDSTGCVEDVSVHNPPLAVFDMMDFEEFRTVLRPNMRLVAFSDGLLDARRGEEFLGEERVRDLVDNMGDADPDHLALGLLSAAQTHSGGHPPDDIAILAIRYTGPPGDPDTRRDDS